MRKDSRVEEIRKRVQEGTYEVDPAAVAEAILDHPHRYSKLNTDQKSLVLALHSEGERLSDIARQVGVHEITVGRVINSHDRPPCFVVAHSR